MQLKAAFRMRSTRMRCAGFLRGAFVAVVVTGLLVPITTFAHHSPAVFDRSREIVLEGVVTEFRWGQPHSWIHMDVENDEGRVENWTIEMNPAQPHLRRAGWNARTVEPGDAVTVTVYPLRNDERGGQFIQLVMPDGTVMEGS